MNALVSLVDRCINEVRYEGPRDTESLLAAVAETARLARGASRSHLRQER
jgi:hypothetical protein